MTAPRFPLFVFILFAWGWAASAATPPDFFEEAPSRPRADTAAALVRPYLDEAAAALAQSDPAAARKWLSRGLELDPDSGDLLLMAARLDWEAGLPANAIIASLGRALKSQRFYRASHSEAFALRARLLLATRQYHTLDQEFEQGYSQRDILASQALSVLHLSLLSKLPDRQRLAEFGEQAAQRWPDDAELAAVMLESGLVPQVHAFQWFDRFKADSPAYRKALFWYIQRLSPGAERLKRCEQYLALGGGDRMVYPWGLESALRAAPASPDLVAAVWLARFAAGFERLDYEAFVAFKAILPSEKLRQELEGLAAAKTRSAYRDFDHDGLADEALQFTGKRLDRWTVDHNQDRLPELELSWEDGLVSSARRVDQAGSVSLRFGPYPAVNEASLALGSGLSELDFPFRALEMPFIELPAEAPGSLADWYDVLSVSVPDAGFDPARLLRLANQRRFFAPASPPRLVAASRLSKGLAMATRSDSDGDGVFDHLLVLEGGVPAIGFRDIENSGLFRAVELYQDGKLAEVLYTDDDHQLSYRYLPRSGAASWDLNRDGRIDTREFRDASGRLVQEFSTRLDGSFDLTAVEGRITQRVLPSWRD